MGLDWDRSRDPWICSKTHICRQTHYGLRYMPWLTTAEEINKNIAISINEHKFETKIQVGQKHPLTSVKRNSFSYINIAIKSVSK